MFIKDVQEVIVAHLENFGRDAHAHCVTFATIEIDNNLHGNPFMVEHNEA